MKSRARIPFRQKAFVRAEEGEVGRSWGVGAGEEMGEGTVDRGLKGGSRAERRAYGDDATKVTLKLVPVVAVVRANELVLQTR
jgi:hypothetical protein